MSGGGEDSDIHFGGAGIMTSISMILGGGYLLLGLACPKPPPCSWILVIHGLTACSIIFSIVQSIRMIGRGLVNGWGALLGSCFYALVIAPIIAVHGMIAVEAMK